MGAVEKKYYGVASATLATMRMVGQMLSMGIATLVFSLFIGKVRITPASYPLFLQQHEGVVRHFFCLVLLRRFLLPGPGTGALTVDAHARSSPAMTCSSSPSTRLLIPLVGVAGLFHDRPAGGSALSCRCCWRFTCAWPCRKPRRRRRAARAAFPRRMARIFAWRARPISAAWTKTAGRASSATSACSWPRRASPASAAQPVSWQTRLLVAAGAAAMLHGRPEWEPPLADGVTVYPGYSFDRNYRAGKGNIAGQAPAGRAAADRRKEPASRDSPASATAAMSCFMSWPTFSTWRRERAE